MSQPLRFKPVNPAHEMVFSPEGGWVAWEDYQSLKDTLQCSFNSNRELKAEVKELKSQPDPLTAYLYAAELAKDDIKRLKAEVERLKAEKDQVECDYDNCHKKLVRIDDVRCDLFMEVKRLKAEVERLRIAGSDSEPRFVLLSDYRHLQAQVERLTKAGDAMVDMVDWEVPYERRKNLEADWNAAKEGKQS